MVQGAAAIPWLCGVFDGLCLNLFFRENESNLDVVGLYAVH